MKMNSDNKEQTVEQGDEEAAAAAKNKNHRGTRRQQRYRAKQKLLALCELVSAQVNGENIVSDEITTAPIVANKESTIDQVFIFFVVSYFLVYFRSIIRILTIIYRRQEKQIQKNYWHRPLI
jgi:hypothetical protein